MQKEYSIRKGSDSVDNVYFSSIAFSLCALFYEIFICLMYFNKKKFKNIENTLFLALLILTFFLIVNEFVYVYFIAYYPVDSGLTRFFCRLYLNGIITWIFIFIYYIYCLGTKSLELDKKRKKRKVFSIILSTFYLACVIAANILPITIYNDGIEHLYCFEGDATVLGYGLAIVLILFVIYVFFIKKTDIKNNQKKSLFVALLCIIGTIVTQFLVSEADYNIQNFQFVIMLMALFFTLENQDNKLLIEHEKSKVEAEKANEAQTEFLTSLSHEIRTPMNTIMGFSDILIREGAINSEVVKKDTNYIHTAAVSLLELINNILDMSRVESGRESIVEKDFDTQALLVELNDLVYSKIDVKKVKFQMFYPEQLPSKLYGDYTKISKILCNLLINTIYYTKEGSIQLVIKYNLIDNNKCGIDFVISSEGSLIDEVDFKKYYKDENQTSNRINNAVIGLTVARLYANMMGCNIVFNSNEGRNISYVTRIECQVISNNAIGNISSLLTNGIHENHKINLEGKKILVVDDNQMNIKLLNRLLVEYKPTLESALNGQECLDKVQDNDYDLIFLDHMMPGMDGMQTISKLKDLKSNLPPIIALTANSYAGIKEMYIDAGFTDYLAKPINRNELNKLLFTTFSKK